MQKTKFFYQMAFFIFSRSITHLLRSLFLLPFFLEPNTFAASLDDPGAPIIEVTSCNGIAGQGSGMRHGDCLRLKYASEELSQSLSLLRSKAGRWAEKNGEELANQIRPDLLRGARCAEANIRMSVSAHYSRFVSEAYASHGAKKLRCAYQSSAFQSKRAQFEVLRTLYFVGEYDDLIKQLPDQNCPSPGSPWGGSNQPAVKRFFSKKGINYMRMLENFLRHRNAALQDHDRAEKIYKELNCSDLSLI